MKMQSLRAIFDSLESTNTVLTIRNLTYDRVQKTPKGTYLFTHSTSTNTLEAQFTFLQKLYADGRLSVTKQTNYGESNYSKLVILKTSLAALVAEKMSEFKTLPLQSKYRLSDEEAREMELLLKEMRPYHFRTSKELSSHIVVNQLGNRYPTISGIAKMTNGYDVWNFDGGFPPGIYKIICNELGLRNQGTEARIVGFTSYKNQ
ncbi:hypothetical protein [Vibrio cholerae]|uniref:hypothetical protein n=1 Tax=Vibrio cholerae TaxID=666 RepID=UPI0011D5B56A|nr:hypothetical protein [Vibrio cholerae]EKF9740239.1 hypothetical protein [Vibrio cholerae]MCX9582613.1 hypothetical protein [Vibrio cholerae]MCX9582926.1 hypothetical protein [Vibrio cholerae]MDV2301559.1 hypothetical protein [Vibrio cholerae]TXY49242.1 hypothetical protein FXE77_12870 [Vibrio cholerae]